MLVLLHRRISQVYPITSVLQSVSLDLVSVAWSDAYISSNELNWLDHTLAQTKNRVEGLAAVILEEVQPSRRHPIFQAFQYLESHNTGNLDLER